MKSNVTLTSKQRTNGRPRLYNAFSDILTKSDFKVEDGNATEHQTDHIRDQK